MLVSSGEPLTVELLDAVHAALPPTTVVLNIYGCTEVAADATSCEAERVSPLQPKGSSQLGETGDSPRQCDAAQGSRSEAPVIVPYQAAQ